MTEIITAVYGSRATVANVVDDLASVGIPREEIKVDNEKNQVQVMTPNVTEPEIKEILERHKPVEIHT